MQGNHAKAVALGGVLAAVAVVIMCLGALVPIATYVCPMLCTMIQFIVLRFCQRRIAWTWYIVVAVLSLLLGPDKEAVMVFIAIGHYPLLKGLMEKSRLRVLLKLLYFNGSIFLAYSILIFIFGMQEIAAENMEFGIIGFALILLMGNAVFLLLDRLLVIMAGKLR